MFSEGISAATDSGKEIAGLKKMQNNFDDTKIEELLTGEFSRGELMARRKYLGILCIAVSRLLLLLEGMVSQSRRVLSTRITSRAIPI